MGEKLRAVSRSSTEIRVILIVDTEAPRVTVWRRAAGGNWAYHEDAGLEATIACPRSRPTSPSPNGIAT